MVNKLGRYGRVWPCGWRWDVRYSRSNLSDGATAEALHGLSSLGTGGKHESNQERDLHRWMKGSYSMTLETIEISMLLNVPWPMFIKVYYAKILVEKGVFTHGSKTMLLHNNT